MNNNFKEFFRKNGFFITLSSVIAILLVSAMYFSYNTINDSNEPIAKEQPIYEPVNKSDVKSYKDNITTEIATQNKEQSKKDKEQPKKDDAQKLKDGKEQSKEEKEKSKEEKEKSKEDKEQSKEDNTQNPTDKKEESTESTTKDKATSNNDEKQKEDTTNKESSSIDKSFALFDDSKEMSWPVSGKIVMDYSIETAVYDKTLEQYRTNDNIRISAPVGSPVKSSAEGIVEKIFTDNESGNTVVINHGNGWLSTYSQLEDDILVAVGQVVEQGEKIASIAEPSNYSLALGPHLEFKITKDDISSDPKLVLAQVE